MEPLLSICIIAKNEQKVIGRCLESIYGIADEIIIVDTGSSDRTKELAIEYTNKVFSFEWVNDFSKARNYAASKASGKWIFVIDADEYVDRENFNNFKNKLKENPPSHNILSVQIVSFVGLNGKDTSLNYHERLYKNDGNISYYRNVHELLKHTDSTKEDRGILNLNVYHSGYMGDTVKEKDKLKRNLSLLLNKNTKDPIDYFFIGNEYKSRGDTEKAILYYQRAYKTNNNPNLEWVLRLLLSLVDCLHNEGRDDEALKIIQSCEEIYTKAVDFKFYKGKIFFENKKYKIAKKIFKDILSNKEYYIAKSSFDFLELYPLKYLGFIYEMENNLEKAVYNYSKALSINLSDDDLWVKLIQLLAKNSTIEELAGFLNNNMVNKQGMTPIRVAKILIAVPNINVQKLSRSLLNEKEISVVENEALLIKNYYLDNSLDEVSRIFEKKTNNEIVSLLNTGIFSVLDFLLLTIETKNSKFEEILFNTGLAQSLGNLLNMIFKKKNHKLTRIEENLFVLLYKQASVLGRDDLLFVLNGKKGFLSKQCKYNVEMLQNP